MSRVAGAFLLFVLTASGGRAEETGPSVDGPRGGATSAMLAVSLRETSDTILVRVQASGDVEPESVEVRFVGRKTVVLARDAEGRPIRSHTLRLPEPVVEEEASASYDADGALLVTLRKQAAARGAGSTREREALAR